MKKQNSKEEVSFNLNSPGHDHNSNNNNNNYNSRPVQELTLDDLNDEDIKVDDKFWNTNKNYHQIQPIHKYPQQQQQNNNHIQQSNQLNYPLNQDLRKYQPKEDQPRTINFDTATFENSLDGINNNNNNEQYDEFTDSNQFNNNNNYNRPPLSQQKQQPNKNRYAKSELEQNQQNILEGFGQSQQDSDFDLSDTKLRRLGIINSLKKDKEEYSNLLNNYSKQFKDTHSDSTRLSEQPISSHNQTSYQINSNNNNNHISDNSHFSNNYHSSLLSKENSRNVFDKYGYMLSREREGQQQQQQQQNQQQHQQQYYNQQNQNRDIQDRISSINYKIREAYQEFSNTKDPSLYQQNYNNNIGATGVFAPTSSQNSVSDPYRISINSFKNSLFSGQKENNSNNINLPNNNNNNNNTNNNLQNIQNNQNQQQQQQYQWQREYNNSLQQQSCYYMDSDEIAKSALQAHHLAVSGYNKQNNDENKNATVKNHPVYNMNKVFGEMSVMNNNIKKHEQSTHGYYGDSHDDDNTSDSRFTHKFTINTHTNQTTTLTQNNNNNSNKISNNMFQPTPFQKFIDAKKKYYDTFLPQKEKIMNDPFKLLKYKMYQRDKQTLENCKSTLSFIDKEISNNVNPELANSIYQKSSYSQSNNLSNSNRSSSCIPHSSSIAQYN